jgi:hypothetical protein
MNSRPFCLVLLTLTLATGCGEEPADGTPRFGVDLTVSRAIADQLSAFQLAVLTSGKQRDCTELQKRCLGQQVRTSDLLVLKDAQGNEGRALRFPASLSGTGVTSQDVAIEVPVGRDYALVIEAISGDSPPHFLGSSCNYLPEVNASRNDPVFAAPMTLTQVDCDPTLPP